MLIDVEFSTWLVVGMTGRTPWSPSPAPRCAAASRPRCYAAWRRIEAPEDQRHAHDYQRHHEEQVDLRTRVRIALSGPRLRSLRRASIPPMI
jgi:hypothetical protein